MKIKFLKSTALFFTAFLCMNVSSQTVSDFVDVPTPDDIEVDTHGNVWVNYEVTQNPPLYRLAKVTPEGVLTDIISENMVLGQFGVNDDFIWINGPWGENGFSYKYDHNGNLIESIPMPYATAIILDPDGTWYITQNALIRLTKVFPDNTTQTLASGFPLNLNLALARGEDGMFYTNNLIDAKVIKMNPDTGEKTLITTLPAAQPYSLGFCAYLNGYLYVPSARHVIYRVNVANGNYTIFAGADQTPGDVNGDIADARFNSPIAVAFSNDGDTMYVTDSGNNKIKQITGMSLGLPENTTEEKIKIYPNPAKDNITIELTGDGTFIKSIEIYAVDGKKADTVNFEKGNNSTSYTYSTSTLQSGNYIAKITTSENQAISKKFIIN